MKHKKHQSSPRAKQPRKTAQSATIHGIPASKLLRAEAARIDVLVHAMPDQSREFITAMAWAYNLAAAFLDSLGAPEKLVRYVPASTQIK